MENTDTSLINAHCRGEAAAFAELLHRHGDCVLGYLTRMTGDPELAEEMFQETFRRVQRKAKTFAGGRFKSWLLTIATRVAVDGYRRKRAAPRGLFGRRADCTDGHCQEPATTAAAVDPLERSKKTVLARQRQQVRLAVDALPAGQRATLVLAYYQQLSYPEVAEILGCSIKTVRTQMSRALRTLARKLPDISGAAK